MVVCENCGREFRDGNTAYANDYPFFRGKYFCDSKCFKNYAEKYKDELIGYMDNDSWEEEICYENG